MMTISRILIKTLWRHKGMAITALAAYLYSQSEKKVKEHIRPKKRLAVRPAVVHRSK